VNDQAPKFKIFISHATDDRDAALALAEWLKTLFGEESFVATIDPGDPWRREIFEALAACSVGIVLGTANSLQRFWVHAEVGALLALKKPVIPLYVGGSDPSQWSELSEIQHCLYDTPGRTRLINGIAKALGVRFRPNSRKLDAALKTAPALQVQSARTERIQTRRDYIRPQLLDMIGSAARSQGELLVAGIANTEFFGADADEINEALRQALDKGMRARFLFLDPESPSALYRRTLEQNRLNSIGIITSSLGAAFEIRNRAAARLRIRLAQDMPVFLCATSERAVCHPYLFSATGAKMPVETLRPNEELYKYVIKHFENLWGERWVLFDIGNVLLRFDHRRVSAALAKLLPAPEDRLHQFIFVTENGPSRNDLLDVGDKDLAWLREEVAREFGASVPLPVFEHAWQDIFDPPQPAARECLRRVQALGLKIGICSNTNEAHWKRIITLLPELADPNIVSFLSHELKAVKTDPAFYRQVTEVTQRPAREHLLLDDLRANLDVAAAAGFRTLQIEDGLDPDGLQRVVTKF